MISHQAITEYFVDRIETHQHQHQPAEAPKGAPDKELRSCCKATVDLHGENNPMMVCSDCKQIIKCFDNERAYRNYQRFCHSRHRSIVATYYSKWWVIVFRSYDSFGS